MTPWSRNSIQFPRLIAEMQAVGFFDTSDHRASELIAALCESMDLGLADIAEVVDRAQRAWDGVVGRASAPGGDRQP